MSGGKILANAKSKAPRIVPGPQFMLNFGAPGRIRTRNLWVRSPALYPLSYRRSEGRTTHVLGRATGFEPVISCATDRRLRPLGYARHPSVPTTVAWQSGLGSQDLMIPSQNWSGESSPKRNSAQVGWPSNGSKKADWLQ